MKRTRKEIIDYIRENAPSNMSRDLALQINSLYGTNYTTGQINSIKKNNKIVGRGTAGYSKGLPTKIYPAEVLSYILGNYRGVGHAENG